MLSHLKIKLASLIIGLGLLTSCSNDNITESDNHEISSESERHYLIHFDGDNRKVVTEADSNYYIYGDILVDKANVTYVRELQTDDEVYTAIDEVNSFMASEKKMSILLTPDRSNIFGNATLWPNGIVNIYIPENTFSSQQMLWFKQAADEWNTKTNVTITFVGITHPGYKIIVSKEDYGCSCTAGYERKIGARDGTMKISDTCDLISYIHEMGHAVGFGHEHQRPKAHEYLTFYNEDDYIALNRILLGNGFRNAADVIKKIKTNLQLESVHNDWQPYEYNSVMHYSSWPRNNINLRRVLKTYDYPMFKHISTGEEIPRPLDGITPLDVHKTNLAYSRFTLEL
jgi:hypothetical protein